MPLGSFVWLSPGYWAAQQIKSTRVPEATFDAGPNGITTWYSAMLNGYRQGIKSVFDALAFLFIFTSLSGLVFRGLARFSLPDLIVNAAAVLFPVWLLAKALWHFGTTEAYAKEWMKLEELGPQWHLENGSLFRLIFKRRDGSYKIDTTTRQQRLNNELSSVRDFRSSIFDYAKSLMKTAIIAAAIYLATSFALNYCFGYLYIINEAICRIFAITYLWFNFPATFYNLIELIKNNADYKKGYQYIINPKVLDPLQELMTLETVKANNPHGDSAFVAPEAASQSLGS